MVTKRLPPGGARSLARRVGRWVPRLWLGVASLAQGQTGTQRTPDVAQAPEPPAEAAAACPTKAPEPSDAEQLLEFTFGSAQVFFRQSLVTPSSEIGDEAIPVSSALLMGEWLASERWAALLLFNLPLEAQSTLRDGQLTQEFVAPSLALGARFSVFGLKLLGSSRVELQLAAMAGRTLGSPSGDRFFPLGAARIHFHTRAGFTLYVGSASAFSENTTAIIYGIGHRF